MRSPKFNLWLNTVLVIALLLQSSAPVWAAPIDNQLGPHASDADVRLEVHLERTTLSADNHDSTRVVVLATDSEGRPVADGTQVALQAEGGHLAERTIETVNGLATTVLRAGNRVVPGKVQAYAGGATTTTPFQLVASSNGAVRLDETATSTNDLFPANLNEVVERARNAIQDRDQFFSGATAGKRI